MPKNSLDKFVPYLDDVLALWDEWGTDFTVGKVTRAQAQKLRDDFQAVLGRMDRLQAQLGQEMGVRDNLIADENTGIEAFAVKFRAAVVAEFGARSPQAKRVPRLSPGRSKPKSDTPDAPKMSA